MVDAGEGKALVGRRSTACSQCQRRKQKVSDRLGWGRKASKDRQCDRNWPCATCQARAVAHLCVFDRDDDRLGPSLAPELDTAFVLPQAAFQGNGWFKIRRSKKRKLNLDDHKSHEASNGHSQLVSESAVRGLGYMEVAELKNYYSEDPSQVPKRHQSPERYPSEILEALNVIPGKAQTDVLIRHALENIDYARIFFYPSQVLDRYEAWWPTRPKQKDLSFSSIILRLCSLALQYLPMTLRSHIEYELGDSVQSLTERYHAAATKLSDFLGSTTGEMGHIQQLFLTALWYKGEGDYAKAWHCLGAAIREAQELEYQKESSDTAVSELEKELRRRIWCTFYTWDRFMSIVLRRPYLITESSCTVNMPSPTFGVDKKELDIPSPVLGQNVRLKAAELIMEISDSTDKFDSANISLLLHRLQDLQDELPDVLTLGRSSPAVDKKHPRIVLLRYKLNVDIFVLAFTLVKPFILFDYAKSISSTDLDVQIRQYRSMACEYGVRIIEMLAHMERLFTPEQAKDNQIAFQPFDITMALCIAAQRDMKGALPLRDQIVRYIGVGLRTLSRIGEFSRISREGSRILREVVHNLAISPAEKDVIYDVAMKMEDKEIDEIERPARILNADFPLASGLTSETSYPVGREASPSKDLIAAEGDLLVESVPKLSSDWMNDMDLGILDDIFHWDSMFDFGTGEA